MVTHAFLITSVKLRDLKVSFLASHRSLCPELILVLRRPEEVQWAAAFCQIILAFAASDGSVRGITDSLVAAQVRTRDVDARE